MSKTEFLQALSAGYFEGCLIRTTEVIISESGDKPLEGLYDMLSLEDAISFFSGNYSEEMVREGHSTRIDSFVFEQRPSEG